MRQATNWGVESGGIKKSSIRGYTVYQYQYQVLLLLLYYNNITYITRCTYHAALEPTLTKAHAPDTTITMQATPRMSSLATLFIALLLVVVTTFASGAKLASNADKSEETSAGFNVWKTLRSNLQQNAALGYGARTGPLKKLVDLKDGASMLLLEVDAAKVDSADGNVAKAADLLRVDAYHALNEQRSSLLDIDELGADDKSSGDKPSGDKPSGDKPPCTVTSLDVNFFKQRIKTEALKASDAMMTELKKNKVELAKEQTTLLKAAMINHVARGGAINQQALQSVMGTTMKEGTKKLAAKSLATGLKAMDLSVEFCLLKKIAGKDIYFKGRLSGDVKTQKLSGSLTLLTRIDVGYLHLAQATVTVKDVNPKDIKNVNVEIKGEFCCGFVTDCEKAQYKGFGRAQSGKQDADVPSSISDAKDKTFTGIITITHKEDGTNSIAIEAGSGGLNLGKLFYVNVGAAVDADRAQKIVNFMGDFAAVGVEKMGLEWKKTKATSKNNATTPGKVTKRLFAKPSFGDVTKYTCDVSDDRFTASGVSVGVLFLVSLLQYKEARLFSVVVVFLVYAKNPCTWYIFSASHNTYV